MEDLKKIDPNLFRNIEKKKQQENNDLESHSKPLDELIATENFTVNEVISESYATSFTPQSEMRFGGPSPSYGGGHTSRLILKVSPDNKDIPVQTLNFNGSSIVKAGDYVSAKIPRYEETKQRGLFQMEKIFYLDRDFKSEESVIELTLFSGNKELRKDRAVDYNRFIKKE